MQIAGTIGLVADILLIGGGLLSALRQDRSLGQRLFWIWTALSTPIFVVVDGLAGLALPDLIAAGDMTSYPLFRTLYDLAFVLGTATLGAGLIAAWFSEWPLWLRGVALIVGALLLLAFGLDVGGGAPPLLFGACVGLAGLAGACLALTEWQAARG